MTEEATKVANRFSPELSRLRGFFLRHPKFLERQENSYFFKEWLTDFSVELSLPNINWDGNKTERRFPAHKCRKKEVVQRLAVSFFHPAANESHLVRRVR